MPGKQGRENRSGVGEQKNGCWKSGTEVYPASWVDIIPDGNAAIEKGC